MEINQTVNNACITFENVSKTFDMRLLYKDVNVELYPSNIVLLTGNNGSGKSTLLRMAAELCRPTQGSIKCHLPQAQCAYLGHATFIYPQLSAYENLEFWTHAVRGKKPVKSEILSILKQVNLEKFAHDPAGIFSRGMSQRLNIARIILQNPTMLLLDEPSTGLDAESKIVFYDCIQDFAQKNACVLWVSHDADIDSKYATHRMHIEKKHINFQKITPNKNLVDKSFTDKSLADTNLAGKNLAKTQKETQESSNKMSEGEPCSK